ncbi:MAG: DUF3500 domain-containing protein [Verrucomicrobiales bacterium]|nr:DUF3500 domain-containing protein [Verrucomicrobiales bacterium]
MKRIPSLLSCAAALVVAFSSANLRAHESAADMADAAKVLLASLTDDQKAKMVYELTDEERENWHFIPKPFEGDGMRGGLTLKDMRPDQRHLAYALLSTALSHRGYTTALEIMSLEQVLWELENQAPKRDTLMYYISIFGEPGSKAWGWRWEGHHLAQNFTIVDGKVVAATPNFFASNPGEVREGPRAGLRVLAGEEDVARRLVQSLDDAQKAKAVTGAEAPEDILTSAEKKVGPLGGEGIGYAALNPEQQKNLKELMDVYIRRVKPDVADDELAAIEKTGLDQIVFAWLGGIEKGQPHYYRVQGPTFLLEYANTQNGANHVHAVWRDFEGDFGRDLLREHYQAHHKAE